MNKDEQVNALNIDRVADVLKLGIKANYVLIQIVDKDKKKVDLILPAGVKKSTTVWEVIKVGHNVQGISAGDIVVDIILSNIEYLSKGDEKYILCDSYNVLLWTNPENYDESI